MSQGRPDDVLGRLKPGNTVYLQGGPGECLGFINLLKANPGAAKGVMLWSCLIPGINTFDYGALPEGPNLVTFMASPALEASVATGRTTLAPMPYSEIGQTLASAHFDLAILHVSQPDANGQCSFGVGCEAPGIAWPRARTRLAFLNQKMPAIVKSETIPLSAIDLAVPIDEPLLSPRASRPLTPTLGAIAAHAAALINDGATVQSGIGEAPGAVLSALTNRRNLRVYSGIVTPEYRTLAEQGCLQDQTHIAGIAWGEASFYDWLGSSNVFAFQSIFETHNRALIGAIPNFVSIGSALEVDLLGALNLEWADGRRVSSVGGAPDYLHGAAKSPGGFSIIALPSITRSGSSRIVKRLEAPSIPAGLADVIVTEHGSARLRGLDPAQRGKAIRAIADPSAQKALWEGRG